MVESQPLTDEEIKEFHKTYSMFDYDENGTISTDHLGTVMRALGVNPSETELQDLINEFDVEGNKVIEFPEFLTLMSRKINEIDTEDEIREAVSIIFKERDSISPLEVWHLMRKFGDQLTDEQVNDMLQQTKTDSDGKIRYDAKARLRCESFKIKPNIVIEGYCGFDLRYERRVWNYSYGITYSARLQYLMERYGLLYATDTMGYALKCPETSQRNIRARIVCGREDVYHCLYDVNENSNVEICKSPKEFTTGRKAVYSGNIDARMCSSSRYMPFIYISNMSDDCLYQRSLCNEEGQIQLHGRSLAVDTACICDFTKGYAFVTEPMAVCYCVPSEEDCSCYKKSCPDNSYMLSSDYTCVLKTSPTVVRCQVSLSTYNKPDVVTEREVGSKECLKINYTENITQPVKWKLAAAIVVTGLFVACLIVPSPVLVDICETDVETLQEEGEVTDKDNNQKHFNTIQDEAGKLIKAGEKSGQYDDFNTALYQKDIFSFNCPSAKEVLFLDAENLQRGLENAPRILDICFMNLKSDLCLIYIDADNDKIVKCTVHSRNDENKVLEDIKEPNRLTKLDSERVAIIYKKKFDIIIFNVLNMTQENTVYVVPSVELEVHSVQYYIEGFTALSPNELILSNRERLFIAKLDKTNETVTIEKIAPSIHKFDTARRLTSITVTTNVKTSRKRNVCKTVVFIADENDKTITSIGKKGDKIAELKGHNRGLQNVRGIAATEKYVFAATSAGVSVYTHNQGKMKMEYSMLIEYKMHVDHTRGLCIHTYGNQAFLALSCVFKRKDVISVFSFETSDLEKP